MTHLLPEEWENKVALIHPLIDWDLSAEYSADCLPFHSADCLPFHSAVCLAYHSADVLPMISQKLSTPSKDCDLLSVILGDKIGGLERLIQNRLDVDNGFLCF